MAINVKFIILVLLSFFTINAFGMDKVFKDERTGIYWTPTIKAKTFSEAKQYCENLRWYGINNWSLPSFLLLKNTVCNSKNYDNKTGCTNPRTKDALSIINQDDAGKALWMLNNVPENPDKAYIFKLDAKGQYTVIAKKTKQLFRCISNERSNTVLAKDPGLNYRYNIILSAYYAYLTENTINTKNYPYDSANARFSVYLGTLGLNFEHLASVEFDIGASATDTSFFDMPNIITLVANWEILLKKRFSFRVGFGGAAAIIPVNIQTSINLAQTADTEWGFAWNLGTSVNLVQFGKYNRFSIVVDGKYTGVKAGRFFGNTFFIGAGFGMKFKVI